MNSQAAWNRNGWIDLFGRHGFRAVALDSRGHGLSEKPKTVDMYASNEMADDVIRLLDHLHVDRVHIIGHSLGARIAFDVARRYRDRINSIVGISIGENLFQQVSAAMLIRAMNGETVPEGVRDVAERILALDNDREALIACLSAPRGVPDREGLAKLSLPVLLVCGDRDVIVGDPTALTAVLPGSQLKIIEGCEHTDVLKSSACQSAVLSFLRRRDATNKC
jgi:pimeloyl-ACP methyl ester carboxylesterase